jgi:hypothetical protein
MGPPAFFATLNDLHGPPAGELPIGAWATLLIARRPEVERVSRTPRDESNDDRRRFLPLRWWVFKAWLRCPMAAQKTPGRVKSTRGMHHRRTVDLDIPRQVAPLQSLTPLLQAIQAYPTEPHGATDQAPTDRIPLNSRKLQRKSSSKSLGRTASPGAGQDAPEEPKKNWGVPVEDMY